jgi:MatE protein
VKVPAFITFAGAAILIPLSPALIFGWGPLPRLGVAGGGAAAVIYYALAAVMLIGYLRSPRSPLKLTVVPLDGRLFRDILRVGLLSAIGTIQANLTVTCITAAVGRFGAEAIAGYGIASRLDYLQIPLLFGLGTAVVTMVGINVGADQAGSSASYRLDRGGRCFCCHRVDRVSGYDPGRTRPTATTRGPIGWPHPRKPAQPRNPLDPNHAHSDHSRSRRGGEVRARAIEFQRRDRSDFEAGRWVISGRIIFGLKK